ncbi:MAG: LysR family transcriptional regulator, partial [Pseudomonadota bacterium]
MLMDPRHLQILWAIVDTGSLSGAARRLGKSQPSLSRTLS